MAGSIHIKVDYPQAVYLKKETLLLEKGLLEVIKHSREYNNLRKKEFIIKTKFKKDMEVMQHLVLSIDSQLPKEELREMNLLKLKEKPLKQQKEQKVRITTEKERKRDSIEQQINEIQEKLARLN
jgi:chromatin segregation and condensation protein Rec8/ScpA/Scc1 (kleisin family)